MLTVSTGQTLAGLTVRPTRQWAIQVSNLRPPRCKRGALENLTGVQKMKHALLTLALLGLFSVPADACLRRASSVCAVQRITVETTIVRQRIRLRQRVRRTLEPVANPCGLPAKGCCR